MHSGVHKHKCFRSKQFHLLSFLSGSLPDSMDYPTGVWQILPSFFCPSHSKMLNQVLLDQCILWKQQNNITNPFPLIPVFLCVFLSGFFLATSSFIVSLKATPPPSGDPHHRPLSSLPVPRPPGMQAAVLACVHCGLDMALHFAAGLRPWGDTLNPRYLSVPSQEELRPEPCLESPCLSGGEGLVLWSTKSPFRRASQGRMKLCAIAS